MLNDGVLKQALCVLGLEMQREISDLDRGVTSYCCRPWRKGEWGARSRSRRKDDAIQRCATSRASAEKVDICERVRILFNTLFVSP